MPVFKGGYTGKILRVNLTTRETTTESLQRTVIEKLLGGRGIAAKYYYDEIGPEAGPFDEHNKIIFVTGPLTGVSLPSTTKFQLATKSPQTGGYLCSNCGGDFGPRLKQCGYDGLIVEGKAEDWTCLLIREGRAELRDAASMVGMTTDKALVALREALGEPKAGAMAIGPAAEKLVRISYLSVDSRAFGRGGPGAVLGSKKLKGIAVYGSRGIPVADGERVDEIRRQATRDLKQSRADHTRYGTPQYITVINELGCMPTRNFRTTYFEGADRVGAETMKQEYFVRNYACYHCPVACGKICEVKEGPFEGARARTEYETIALLGPDCGVDDFGAIVAGNQLCDELGIDTMSAGNAVALTMELYERGLITEKDTDGIEARFGSGQAMVGILRLIGERRAIGDLLAEGMKTVESRHPEWKPFIVHVKGLPFAAYDPRGFYGNALTYGTSSRGACHNVGGWTIRAELTSGQYDRFALEGKGKLVKTIQDNRAYVDSLGICTVVRGSMFFTDSPKGDTLEAVTGHPFTPRLLEIGSRIYTLERMILNREGIRRENDRLPRRIVEEVVPTGPIKGHKLTREMYEELLDEYYEARGWDDQGVPREETVRDLGLNRLVG